MQGWYKIAYSFKVFEFAGERDYRDERVRAHVPTLIRQGTSPLAEVGDVTYDANYGWYYSGVANKGHWINQPSSYSSKTFVQTSTQYVNIEQRIVDVVTKAGFQPPSAQGGHTSITLRNDNSGFEGMDFTMDSISYRWVYGDVVITDADNDGWDDGGERETCPGQQGLQDRTTAIRNEFADQQTDLAQAQTRMAQYKSYLAAAIEENNYLKYSQVVNTATDALGIVAGLLPVSRIGKGLLTAGQLISVWANPSQANVTLTGADGVVAILDDAWRSAYPTAGAIVKGIGAPAVVAAELGVAARDFAERQRLLAESARDIRQAEAGLSEATAAAAAARNKMNALEDEMAGLVACSQWSAQAGDGRPASTVTEFAGAAFGAAGGTAAVLHQVTAAVAVLTSTEPANLTLSQMLPGTVRTAVVLLSGGNDTVVISDDIDTAIDGGGGSDIVRYAGLTADIAWTFSAHGNTFVQFRSGHVARLDGVTALVSDDGVFQIGASGIGGWEIRADGTSALTAGTDGADVMRGSARAETLAGGAGDDTYWIDAASDKIIERTGEGIDLVRASVSYTLDAEAAIELLATDSESGNGAINLTGNAFAQTIIGNAGSNILHGGGGADFLIGLGGDDQYYIDSQDDQVIERAGEGTDVIYTQASYVLAAGVSIERIHAGSGPLGGPVPAINLTGNEFGQLIYGNSTANVLSGLGGSDWLRGYEGNDTLYGGDDSDTLDGGTGADTMYGGRDGDTYIVDNIGDVVIEEAGGGFDTVEASVTYTLPDHFEYLTLTGSAAIDGTGNTLDNYMVGNAGANVLRGLAGDDTLIGGLGNDRLDGGAGVDTARFTGARAGYDITYLGGGEYRVTGADGTDTLKDIEQLQFGDRLVTIKTAFKAPVQWSAVDAVGGGLKWLVGDFTGDGKDDLFRQTSAGGDVLQSNGLFFAGYNSWTGAGAGSNGEFYAGDFNGDGKDDLLRGLDGIGAQVLISDGSRFSFAGTWSPAGSGSDGRFFVGDFNGDGKDDLLRWMDGIGAQVLLSSGSSFSFAGTWTPAGNGSDGRFYIGDFNGDGKDDIMRGLDGIGVQVFLSTGSGFAAAGTWTPAGNGSDNLFHIADFNGDGKDDVVRQIAGVGMQAFLSTGTSFSSEGVWSGTSAAPGSRFLAGDFTGGRTGDMAILGTGGIEVIA